LIALLQEGDTVTVSRRLYSDNEHADALNVNAAWVPERPTMARIPSNRMKKFRAVRDCLALDPAGLCSDNHVSHSLEGGG